jgi:hypothetical protein
MQTEDDYLKIFYERRQNVSKIQMHVLNFKGLPKYNHDLRTILNNLLIDHNDDVNKLLENINVKMIEDGLNKLKIQEKIEKKNEKKLLTFLKKQEELKKYTNHIICDLSYDLLYKNKYISLDLIMALFDINKAIIFCENKQQELKLLFPND